MQILPSPSDRRNRPKQIAIYRAAAANLAPNVMTKHRYEVATSKDPHFEVSTILNFFGKITVDVTFGDAASASTELDGISYLPNRLENKIARITGGTSGIGAATVELFVAEGAKVVFTGRNAEAGLAIADRLGPSAHFFRADVTREQDVKASIEQTTRIFGRIDTLFNNAGGRTEGDALSITQDDFEHAMNLLLGSVLFGIRYAAPIMQAQGGGSIISNASVAAHRSHMGGYLYSIAKAAVVHAARIAAVQLGVHNIRVNTISPGAIATPIFLGGSDVAADMLGEKVTAKMGKLANNLAKANALHTSGFPQDIAYGALYLASDESRFVTGLDLTIDGGMSAGGRTNFEDLRSGSRT